MTRFPEIDGLRAWLAWAVMISHVFIVLNYWGFRAGELAPMAGAYAVAVFVMVSGFVITGLVTERNESWPRYILRRAFRIFPAYWVALLVGAVTTAPVLLALANAQWGVDPESYFIKSLQGGQESIAAHPWTHWLLHIVLLQGVVPDSALPWSSVTFVGPAWTLSLEWQFYLVAPALIWAMRSRKWAAGVVLLAIVCAALYKWGALGSYNSYSTLPGGLWLFVIGIASRLALPALRTLALPVVVITLAAFGAAILEKELLPFSVWIAFLAYLSQTGKPAQGHLDGAVRRASNALIGSQLATMLGQRSYSVYIIHMPMLKLALMLLPLRTMTQEQALVGVGILGVALTLVASEVLYRFVERPMIRLGAQLSARRGSFWPPRDAGALPAAVVIPPPDPARE